MPGAFRLQSCLGIFSVIVVGYDALWENDPIKRRWRAVGFLQKSPQQACAFKGRHPGSVAIGFGG